MAFKIYSVAEASASPVFISVLSGSYVMIEKKGTPVVKPISFNYSTDKVGTVLREIVHSDPGRSDLSEAEVIVVAVRGVKDEGGRELIDELSTDLNVSIGSSSALTYSDG